MQRIQYSDQQHAVTTGLNVDGNATEAMACQDTKERSQSLPLSFGVGWQGIAYGASQSVSVPVAHSQQSDARICFFRFS